MNSNEKYEKEIDNNPPIPNKIKDNLWHKVMTIKGPRKIIARMRFLKLSLKDRVKTRLEYAKYNNKHKGMTNGEIKYEDFTTSEEDLLKFDKIIDTILGGLQMSENNKELEEELEIIDEYLDILLTEQSPLLEPTTKEKVQHLISRHSNKGKRLMLEHEERKNEIPPFANNSPLGANGRSEQEEEIVRSMRYSNPITSTKNTNDLMRQLDILKYQIESKQDNKIESNFVCTSEFFPYVYETDLLFYDEPKIEHKSIYKAIFEDGQILVAVVLNIYPSNNSFKQYKDGPYQKDTEQIVYNWYLNEKAITLSVISQPSFDYDGLSQDMLNLIGVDNVLDSFKFKLNQSISNEKLVGSEPISQLNEPMKTVKEVFNKNKSIK